MMFTSIFNGSDGWAAALLATRAWSGGRATCMLLLWKDLKVVWDVVLCAEIVLLVPCLCAWLFVEFEGKVVHLSEY